MQTKFRICIILPIVLFILALIFLLSNYTVLFYDTNVKVKFRLLYIGIFILQIYLIKEVDKSLLKIDFKPQQFILYRLLFFHQAISKDLIINIAEKKYSFNRFGLPSRYLQITLANGKFFCVYEIYTRNYESLKAFLNSYG